MRNVHASNEANEDVIACKKKESWDLFNSNTNEIIRFSFISFKNQILIKVFFFNLKGKKVKRKKKVLSKNCVNRINQKFNFLEPNKKGSVYNGGGE